MLEKVCYHAASVHFLYLQSMLDSAYNVHSDLFALRAFAICTALYMVWRSRSLKHFQGKSVSKEACCIKVLSMFKSRWSVLNVKANRHIRYIGHQLGFQW